MTPRDAAAKLDDYRRRIAELRREMRALRAAAQPEEVRDYEFATYRWTAPAFEPVRCQARFDHDPQHGRVVP
jgi:hypothetical protein